jgi:hypothetical protein
MKKSWRDKLADDKGLPKVGPVTGKMAQRWGTGPMTNAGHLSMGAARFRQVWECGSPLPLCGACGAGDKRWRATVPQDANAPARPLGIRSTPNQSN